MSTEFEDSRTIWGLPPENHGDCEEFADTAIQLGLRAPSGHDHVIKRRRRSRLFGAVQIPQFLLGAMSAAILMLVAIKLQIF